MRLDKTNVTTFVFSSLLIVTTLLLASAIYLVPTGALAAVIPVLSNGTLIPAGSKTDHNEEVKFIGDYRKDLKAFVKRCKTDDPMLRIGAIVDLCMLHDQIVNDPRFDNNHQLKGFRAVAADRLKKCRKQIELEIKRFERKHGPTVSKSEGQTEPMSPDGSQGKYLEDKLIELHQLKFAMEDMHCLTQISGGPISLWNHTGSAHGPNGVCDYGPDLVRLIETTINSDFWRRNGGTGIIEYYQPLRILVVSASSQVHEQMTDLLETLRYNGR
jgi:hypothetical protein